LSGRDQVPQTQNWCGMQVINPPKSARRLSLAALLIVFTAAASDAQAGGADALRGMAQAEKDAGRLSRFHVVEVYRAIGVTMAPSATRATREVEAEIARKWAQEFCVRASRDLHWDRRWSLIVYAYGQAERSYSCLIPTSQDAFKGTAPRQNSESRTTLDDGGRLLPGPGDEIE
jgi:hypothetical protein